MPLLYIVSFKEFGSLVCLCFGTMSNFEKRNLRSGQLLRPGHVTFGVIGSSFFRNVMANLAALRAAVFFAISEKSYGGGVEINPPAGARVNSHTIR